MEYIKISKEIFEQFAPTAVDAENDIYNALGNFFQMAYQRLTNDLLGRALGSQLPSLFDAIERDKPETLGLLDNASWLIAPQKLDAIRENVLQYVVNAALYDAIPQLDLVLTNNGFGIVSTQQIAPASAERVERLRKACATSRDIAFDSLLISLPANSLTKELLWEDRAFYKQTSSLIWTLLQLNNYCGTSGTDYQRSQLDKARPSIFLAERQIRQMISNEQFDAILKKLREGETEPVFEGMLPILYGLFTSLYAAVTSPSNTQRCSPMEHELLAYLDQNTYYFVEYGNSQQYKARHFEAYRNQRKDGCFFF